jgi:hypothetical protein
MNSGTPLLNGANMNKYQQGRFLCKLLSMKNDVCRVLLSDGVEVDCFCKSNVMPTGRNIVLMIVARVVDQASIEATEIFELGQELDMGLLNEAIELQFKHEKIREIFGIAAAHS